MLLMKITGNTIIIIGVIVPDLVSSHTIISPACVFVLFENVRKIWRSCEKSHVQIH